jgi:hypothetical protein
MLYEYLEAVPQMTTKEKSKLHALGTVPERFTNVNVRAATFFESLEADCPRSLGRLGLGDISPQVRKLEMGEGPLIDAWSPEQGERKPGYEISV